MTKADFARSTPAGKADHSKATKAKLAAARKQAAELKAKREAEDAAREARIIADAAAVSEALRAKVAAAQPQPAAATADELAFDFDLPSWKRVLVGFVLGISTAGATGYGIGMIAAYCIAGIMTLTTSAGLALFMSFLVWLIAIYASWKIGGWVGGKVFASVVMPDGLASRSIDSVSNAASNAKSAVAGWFTSKPAVMQFTGAHTKAAAA
jgi:hypothetical protein